MRERPWGFICSLGAFFLVWIVLYTGCRCSTCYARLLRRVMVWAAMAVVESREVAAPACSTPVWTSYGVSAVAVASSRRASCLSSRRHRGLAERCVFSCGGWLIRLSSRGAWCSSCGVGRVIRFCICGPRGIPCFPLFVYPSSSHRAVVWGGSAARVCVALRCSFVSAGEVVIDG